MDSITHLTNILKNFPGLGIKSARRIVFHLLKKNQQELSDIANAISTLKSNLHVCSICGNISDKNPCYICSDPLRDKKTLCIIEDIESLTALEQAGIYNGVYHVLGERVIPYKGEDLSKNSINFLLQHIQNSKPDEIIIATNPLIEGDLTFYTIIETIRNSNFVPKKITRLAQGLPIGSSIEFTDRATLHTSFELRFPVDVK